MVMSMMVKNKQLVVLMSHKLGVIFVLCVLLTKLQAEGPKDPGLITEVKPNVDAAKGLICYQCRSISTELAPLCDKSIFRLSTPAEKHNMSFQCPYYQGAFCFIKVIHRGKTIETIRGCSGSMDIKNNLMKVGCMTKKFEVLCLCDTKFCNRATSLFHTSIALILVIITIILNSKMCFL